MADIVISFNTDVTVGNDVIDVRCFLELIALKLEYKPIILAIIGILEAYFTLLISSLTLLSLSTEALLSYFDTLLNLAQSAVDVALTPYNKVKTLTGSIPCVALDRFFQPIDDWVNDKAKRPFNKIKEKYLRLRRSLNLELGFVLLLENNKQFFSALKALINQLPEFSITVSPTPSSAPGAGVVKGTESQTFTSDDPFKINEFKEGTKPSAIAGAGVGAQSGLLPGSLITSTPVVVQQLAEPVAQPEVETPVSSATPVTTNRAASQAEIDQIAKIREKGLQAKFDSLQQ